MKRDLSLNPTTPVIAAAMQRRGRRGRVGPGGGGIARKNPENNYVAGGRVTNGKRSRKAKKAGARPGNLNAVVFPLDTPYDLALYRRIAAFTRGAKMLVRAVNRDLRARRAESEQQ